MNRNLLVWTCPECKHEEDILLLNNNYCCSVCGYTKPKESSSSEANHPTHIPQLSFQDQLINLLKSIKVWEKLKEYDLENSVSIFIQNLSQIYLDYFQYNLEEVKLIASGFINELLWATEIIRECYVLPELRYYRTSYALDESWNNVCWTASEIKIFNDMFSSFTKEINASEFWNFVESYKNQRMHPDREKIPKNIPYDHWWWFTEYDLDAHGELLE